MKKIWRMAAALGLASAGIVSVNDVASALSPAIGWLDGVQGTNSSTEKILIGGWALTSDYPLSALGVRIVIDGAVYPMDSPGYVLANTYRPDVGAAYPGYGNYHGFSFWVRVPVGSHTICVQAQNSGVYNTLQGCTSYFLQPVTWGFGAGATPDHRIADAMPHSYGTTETTSSERSLMENFFNGRMTGQYDARTDMTVQGPLAYSSALDAYWYVSLEPAAADATCMDPQANNVCGQTRIRFNTNWASSQSVEQKRQGACHEIGHSVGFDDSVPQSSLGCMSGGGLGELSGSEIWSINAQF